MNPVQDAAELVLQNVLKARLQYALTGYVTTAQFTWLADAIEISLDTAVELEKYTKSLEMDNDLLNIELETLRTENAALKNAAQGPTA